MTILMTPGAGTGASAGKTAISKLERHYRWALRAYPRSFRARHGAELIATLLETAHPRQTLPSPRELIALVYGGLRTRAVAAAGTEQAPPAWVDGLHLGVLALAIGNLAMLVPYATSVPLWIAVSAASILAIMRGRVGLAIPLVGLTGIKVYAIVHGYPWLDETLLPIFADPIWDRPALYGVGGPIAPIVEYTVEFTGLLVLAAYARPEKSLEPGRSRAQGRGAARNGQTATVEGRSPGTPRMLRTRSWLWWTAVPLLAGSDPTVLDIVGRSPHTIMRIGLETALLALAIWAGQVASDQRWALAAGLHLVVVSAVFAENLADFTRNDLAYWALLAFLTAATTVAPYQARRHALL